MRSVRRPPPRLRVARADLRRLSPFERFALGLARAVNESPDARAAAQSIGATLTSRLVELLSASRVRVAGLDRVASLRPDRGVVIAANHRSFFDLPVVATHLRQSVSWARRLYFPVRSEFFYDRPLGLLVNALASSLTMFPPIFRAGEKRGTTRAGLDFLAAELARRGTVVGIHPEGTRGKGRDPYELLPPEPGFGRLVLAARPVVLPVFVSGLSNSLARECRSWLSRSPAPISIAFGDPVALDDLAEADPRRLRTQVEATRRVLDEIRALATLERARAASYGRGSEAAAETNRPS